MNTTFEVEGLKINAFDEHQASCFLRMMPKGVFTVALNAEKIIEAQKDSSLRSAINSSYLSYIDGIMASLLVARKVHGKIYPKIDLPSEVVNICLSEQMSLSVVGGTPLDNQLAQEKLRLMGINVAPGMHGYEEESTLCAFITDSLADFTLLGLGSPKQELVANIVSASACNTRIIPCGGAIKIIAGVQKRAPKLIQNLWLETPYRLLSEPSRALRYAKLFKIIPIIIRAWRETK